LSGGGGGRGGGFFEYIFWAVLSKWKPQQGGGDRKTKSKCRICSLKHFWTLKRQSNFENPSWKEFELKNNFQFFEISGSVCWKRQC